MDMTDGSTNAAIANLSLSDPRCTNESCNAFLEAENASQAAIPWTGLFLYGHWATWYYLAIIFLLSIIHITRTWRDRRRGSSSAGTRPGVLQKSRAIGRYVFYRHISIGKLAFLPLPGNGVLTFLISMVLFVILLAFAKRPWYREHLGYGSPPLAIRSGLMAFACIPILIALAGKANIVTLLTGISHERLNIIHQWVAWLSFVLSLAHSIPYFIQSYNEGPFYGVAGSENLKKQFYTGGNTGANEYTGAPPLVVLFVLCILSLPPFRKSFYESFYFVHILLAITYLGTLFWHSWNTLDSWAYLWASLALWLTSYFARAFWYTQPLSLRNEWFETSATTLTKLPGGMTKIEILAPPRFKFTPGQHCFLRFPSISLLDNHPFTITSAPVIKSINGHAHRQTLTFYARSYAGFTQKLERYCAASVDDLAHAWIDGPYGGVNRPLERLYDSIILVAGGSGITACLPWLLSVAKMAENEQVTTSRIVLIWVVKNAEHFAWIAEELREAALLKSNKLDIQLRFFVSGSSTEEMGSLSASLSDIEKKPSKVDVSQTFVTPAQTMSEIGEVEIGRPKMNEVVRELVVGGKTIVLGCGPEALRRDLANAVAALQMNVLKGEAMEVALYTEAFG